MQEHRCTKCNGLLCKGNLIDAEIVCHKCKTMNVIKYYSQQVVTLGITPEYLRQTGVDRPTT